MHDYAFLDLLFRLLDARIPNNTDSALVGTGPGQEWGRCDRGAS